MKSEAVDKINQALEKEASLVTNTLLLIFGLLTLYFVNFGLIQRLPSGGPTSWGEFGDFFGGIVNPIIGIVTVILVVRTLKATREEAAETRAQLEQQLEHQREERVLGDMRTRLERALEDWQRMMDERCQKLIYGFVRGNFVATKGELTRAQALRTIGLLTSLDTILALEQGKEREAIFSHWEDNMEGCSQLLEELASYCMSYQQKSQLSGLPDYYRRRVVHTARVLHKMGLLHAEVAASLEPHPLDKDALSQSLPGTVPHP